MYEHLKGSLISAEPARAVVECGGIGFLMKIPLSTFERLPAPGSECLVLTHLHVREEAMELYGFATEAERRMFRRLVSVSGVGPSVAISVMSQLSVTDILGAIRRGEARLLQRAKGVGRKTAERIALELKGAVAEIEALVDEAAGDRAGAGEDLEGSAARALVALGYSEEDAWGAARGAAEELGPAAELGAVIREGLKRVR